MDSSNVSRDVTSLGQGHLPVQSTGCRLLSTSMDSRIDEIVQEKIRAFKQREIEKANDLENTLARTQTDRNRLGELFQDAYEGLIRAIHTNNIEALNTYCHMYVYINQSDSHGVTPLMLAASRSENPEMLEILLARGAHIHAVDDRGMMALDYFKENMGYEFFEELGRDDKRKVIRSRDILLQAGYRAIGTTQKLYEQALKEWRIWKSTQEATGPLYKSVQYEEDGSWQSIQVTGPRDVYKWVFNHILVNQRRNPQSEQHVNPELTFQDVNELLFFCSTSRFSYRSDLIQGRDCIDAGMHDWTKGPLGEAMFFNWIDRHPIKGNPYMVNILLKAGANIENTNTRNQTPLMHAALFGQTHILKYLLNAGANRNSTTTDGNGDSALMLVTKLAIMLREERTTTPHAMMKTLLNDPATNKELRNTEGDTVLLAALKEAQFLPPVSENDPYETIKILVDSGVDLRAQDQNGETALMLAIKIKDTKIIKLLLSKDPGLLEIADNNEITPLRLAILEKNSLRTISFFLKLGVHVDTQDTKGHTALMLTRDINVMKLLLSPPLGARTPAAEIDLHNKLGETVLTKVIQSAIKKNNLNLNYLEVINYLLSAGANINHVNPCNGYTPLAYTDPDIIVKYGGKPDSPVAKQIRQLLVDRIFKLENERMQK